MQQAQKAAAEPKAQCRARFHFKGKARAIQPQFVDLTRYIGLRITRSLSVAESASFDIPALLGGPA